MTKKRKLSERRKYLRAKRALGIYYRLYKRNGKRVDGVWSFSTTRNMSIVGILFSSQIPYLIGDIIQLRVVMSGILDVFRGYGRVVRVEQKDSRRSCSVAIAFVEK